MLVEDGERGQLQLVVVRFVVMFVPLSAAVWWLSKYARIACARWHAGVHVGVWDRRTVLLWLARMAHGGFLQQGSHACAR